MATVPATYSYGRLIAALLVLALYTYVPVYGASFLWAGVQPIHWIGACCVAVLPVLLSPRAPRWTRTELLPIWIAVYVCTTIAWYVGFGAASLDQLKARVIGTTVLGGAYVAFRRAQANITWARLAMLAAMLIAVAANLYNVVYPFAFLPVGHESATPGRASGFYMNPNVAGGAMLAALILGIRSMPKYMRVPLLLIGGAGIAVTVSRSSILGWLLLWMAVGWLRVVPRVQFLGASIALMLFLVASIGIAVTYLDTVAGIDLRDVLERLSWFADPSAIQDASQSSRRDIALAALRAFEQHPLIGSGLGATDSWEYAFSTHNMFLRLMVEQGLLGAFIYLGFIFATTWGAPEQYRFECTLFAAFLTYWAMFSHNILDEYTLLIAGALSAAMAGRPTQEDP